MWIDKDRTLILRGITSHPVKTLGGVTLSIAGHPVRFQVVSNDFPFPQNGILGSEFLRQNSVSIDYRDKYVKWGNIYIRFDEEERIQIKPRSVTPFYVRIGNPEARVGHVPTLQICEGVYAGNAVVTNDKGRAYLRVFNTTEIDFDLIVPTIRLEEFDQYQPSTESSISTSMLALPSTTSTTTTVLPITERVADNAGPTYEYNNDDDHDEERFSKIMQLLRLDHLTSPEEREIVNEMVRPNTDRFHLPDDQLPATTVIQHSIYTTNNIPINTRQYRYPLVHKQEIDRQVKELLQGDIIEYSTSPYNSPLWIVPKKPDSKGTPRWRMVIDYRALNEKTIGDAYPLPNINEILDQLGSAKYFSVFDLASGFHQIPMNPTDAPKTAFSTPYGHYQFKRMPFGLRNAPATFQRLMDNVLTGLQGNELFVYLDDIVIYAKSLQEHTVKFNRLMSRLREANLKLQPDKCEFLRREVGYLGHVIGENGVKPDPGKIVAVENFPTPRNPKNIKQFLGLAGYYRRFIPNFSKVAKPLTDLLKKTATFKWDLPQARSFDALKKALITQPILQFPDFTMEFNLTTDASGHAIGGVLSQGPIGKDLPIAYASRVLNPAEQKYSTIEKECLAIVYCISHFRPYLYGRKFKIITDHKPLVWLHSIKDPTSRLWKWKLKLSEYEYETIHKQGRANANADALSRNPPQTITTTTTTIHDNDDPAEEAAAVNAIKRSREPDDDVDQPPSPQSPTSSSSDNSLIFEARPRTKRRHVDEKKEDETSQVPTVPLPPPPLSPASSSSSDNSLIFEARPRIKQQHIDEKKEEETSQVQTVPLPSPIPTQQPTSRLEEEELIGSNKESERHNDNDGVPAPQPDDIVIELTDDPHLRELDTAFLDPESATDSLTDYSMITTGSSNDTSPEEIFDNPDPPFENSQQQYPLIVRTRETIIYRKDTLVVFIDTEGNPQDRGATQLLEAGFYPNFSDAVLERSKVVTESNGKRKIIGIAIKEHPRLAITRDNIVNGLRSLYLVTQDLGLPSFSIAKTNKIEDIPWKFIESKLREIFAATEINITVCRNEIVIPPPDKRLEIIKEKHASAVGGHKGVTKTYNRIRQKYCWNKMKQDVQEYIRACRQCQIRKLTRVKTRQPMVITDTPGSAFDKISMDIVGPLPKTKRGNEYILTMQDLLTKYSVAVPLQRARAFDVADAFLKQFICQFGAPRAILTDQGANFLSALMKQLARKFRIKQYSTTAYHPQSNGSIERSHHVLAEYLKQYVDEKASNWDEWTDLAMFSYNTSVHEGTGFTPFELVYGKLAREPASDPPMDENLDPTYQDYLMELAVTLQDTQETARHNLNRSKLRSKRYYDRRANPQNFKPGDHVYLLKEPRRGKFADQYTGPHTVLEILENQNAKIDHFGQPRVVHFNKLKMSRAKPTNN